MGEIRAAIENGTLEAWKVQFRTDRARGIE
jgi:queuine tRNA-ribosyltransferase